MDGEDQNCNDQLKIIVRQREYSVSKKFVCSVVPYFEKMFCCDLLESKENKVELDFDERVFDIVLNWIHSESFIIQMDYVISLYDAADYLMINDPLLKPCSSYFHEKFTIEHIPIVLPQVTKVSKLINSTAIENFICRHFLTIANTKNFLDYPVDTIEAILKLDLMVYSEYQILEAIYKWVNKKADSRKKFLPQLLNCIRWTFIDSSPKKSILKLVNGKLDSENHYFAKLLNCVFRRIFNHGYLFERKFKKLIKIQSGISPYDECRFNRTKQRFFISIQQKDENLRINMFDNELCGSPMGDFTRDDTMPVEFVHGEHISDVLFDSGTKGVRIDWTKKTFRWLDFKVKGKTYYSQLMKFIVKFSPDVDSITCYLEDKNTKPSSPITTEEYTFLEYDGKFILIGKTLEDKEWFGLFPAKRPSWFNKYQDHERSFQATILDNVVYILTKDCKFLKFEIKTRTFSEGIISRGGSLDFNDLILTSHAKNDDKVVMVNKTSGKVFTFRPNQDKWVEKCRILNVSLCSNNLSADSNKLIAFTSTFLPMKVIKPLYRRNVSPS